METRSNHILVGTVTLLLLAAIIAGAFWFSRISDGQDQFYDIFFKQSVNGIAKGSSVTFSGVPSGQVKVIELWKNDPSFVRVRIALKPDTPILQGTTASIQGVGFTGVSEIQLNGAIKGAPPLTCPEDNPRAVCPEGVPVIPTRRGGLGELLNNAPQLVERLTTLTERLTQVLDDKNQKAIAGILANVDSLTGQLARKGPEMGETITETRLAVQKIGLAADQIAQVAGAANTLLNEDGRSLVADLRKTLQSAQKSLDSIDRTAAEARPGMQAFSKQTMPEVGLLIRDLREMSRSLRAISEKLDQQGAGSLLNQPALPDYKP